MIDGIKIDMRSEDLRGHLKARAEFHTVKALWYRQNAESLRQGQAEAPNLSNDPVSSLERSREQHEQKAAYFETINKYLIPDETYRLSETDLARLEFAANYF